MKQFSKFIGLPRFHDIQPSRGKSDNLIQALSTSPACEISYGFSFHTSVWNQTTRSWSHQHHQVPLTARVCPVDNHSQFHKRKTGVYESSCYPSHYQMPSLFNEAVLRIHSRRKPPWSQNQETNWLIINYIILKLILLFSSAQTPSNFSLPSPCFFSGDLLPSRETLFYFFWPQSPLTIF